MVLNLENIHDQVRALLEVVSGEGDARADSPLAAIAGAVLEGEAEISSGDMPLSAFNVRLSQGHGTDGIPVISFPALGYLNASWDGASHCPYKKKGSVFTII